MAKKSPITTLKGVMAFNAQMKAIEECEMMAHYAQTQGKKVPAHLLKQMSELQAILHDLQMELESGNLNNVDPRSLNMSLIGGIHGELAELLSPASPATVLLMERNKRKGLYGILGPVPLVRRLNIMTIICLFTFLGLFFADEVNSYTVNGDILSYSGMSFIYNELVIVCIAALGASFYALFEVYKYIAKDSYDPKYDSIYLIRFILGIVSGVILAQFIFVSPEILGEDVGDTADNLSTAQELGGFMTYKPLLAFLGGFSARVVHKILNSMVEAIETFISGSARDMVTAREEAAKVKMQDKLNAIKQKNAQTDVSERMKSTMKLMQLKQDLNNGAQSEEVDARLTLLMNELMKPVGGVDIDFDNINKKKNANNNNSSVDVPPIVEDYDPSLNENFEEIYHEEKHDKVSNDVDDINVPDFPEDMDNPDFPMPTDMKEDFDPNDPNLKV